MTEPKKLNERCVTPFDYSARSLLLHPLVVFIGVWGFVVFLYSLRLSGQLVYSTAFVSEIAMWIVVPYSASVLGFQVFCAIAPKRRVVRHQELPNRYEKLSQRLTRWFVFWVICTLVEIAASGGVPIVWLIQGSAKTYFDFGIHSVHGLLNSLLLAIGLSQLGLFSLDHDKRRLRIPAWIIVWSIVVITRNMMVVFLIEAGVVWGTVRGIRKRTLLYGTAVIATVILAFGYIGDLRSGAEAFRVLAMPTAGYPAWLPSGVLWIYIYLTTPLGNLANTISSSAPQNNLLFPNTVAMLFPSVLRGLIYRAESVVSAVSGELVTDAFNVSTAYVGPYQDYGHAGIVCFSVALGIVAAYCWQSRSFRGALIYGVLCQCAALSIFFNHLFFLPIISQCVWLSIFFGQEKPNPSANAAME